jgi:hypothetical protein
MTRKNRLDVTLNEKAIEIFEELEKLDNDSRCEVFRKAMITYHFLRKQIAIGSKIFIEEEGSEQKKRTYLSFMNLCLISYP